MMNARARGWVLFLFLGGALVSATGALADGCADWARALSIPHLDPSISGSICRLHGDQAYVAGIDLAVVDLTVWDRPVIVGREALPAPAQDVALAWPRAYVACGDAGLVELDITSPASPHITRRFDPPLPITMTTVVDGIVVGLDAGSVFHFLAPAANGQLAEMSRWGASGGIVSIGTAGRYLVILDMDYLSVIDISHVSSIAYRAWLRLPSRGWSLGTSCLAIGEDAIVVVRSFQFYGSYTAWTETEVCGFTVTDTGQLVEKGDRQNIGGTFHCAATGDGFVAIVPDVTRGGHSDAAQLSEIPGLGLLAQFQVSGRSVGIADNILAVIGDSGLTTMRLPDAASGPIPVAVHGGLDGFVQVNGELASAEARWSWPWGVLTSTVSHVDGHLSGSASETVNYAFVSGSPLGMLSTMDAGFFNDSSDFATDPCGLDRAWVMDVDGQMALFVVGDGCSRRLRLWDASRREFLGTIVNNCVEPGWISEEMVDGILWTWGAGGWRRFNLASATPLEALPPLTLHRPGTMFPVDRGLLVVRVDSAGEFDAYDTSNPAETVFRATVRSPGSGSVYWFGRRMVNAGNGTIDVVDFSDPASPVLSSSTNLTDVLAGPGASDGRTRLVLGIDSRRFRVVDVSADGRVSLHQAFHTTDAATTVLVSGDVMYADTGYAIRAYDLSRPDEPAELGAMARGSGTFAFAGDKLASGTIILPRDCRELAQVRDVAIEVLPYAKPGGRSGYEGPALVPVFVRRDPLLDVDPLDVTTIRFGPLGASPVAGPSVGKAQIPADGDHSGSDGALYWFRLDESGIGPATSEVRLTGRTAGGFDVLGIGWLRPTPPQSDEDGVMMAAVPNPFNPCTALAFSVRNGEPTRLTIHDLQGRCVRVLFEDTAAAGRRTVIWEGTDDTGLAVASGVYIARLVTGGAVVTTRLALLR